jgi:hypothetical protein
VAPCVDPYAAGPSAVFPVPVVLVYKAPEPKPALLDAVLLRKVSEPNAVILFAVVDDSPALMPKMFMFVPVVFPAPAPCPNVLFPAPVVLLSND